MFKNLINKIKGCESCKRRRHKLYHWLAKGRLIRRYEYLNEVNKILENYITSRILDGGSAEFIQKSRSDLVAKQNEIRETEKMVNFLKSQ